MSQYNYSGLLVELDIFTLPGPVSGFFLPIGPGPGFRVKNSENQETPKNRIFSKIPGSGLPGPENPVPGPARVRTLNILMWHNVTFSGITLNTYYIRDVHAMEKSIGWEIE